MSEEAIISWHDGLLEEALKWREQHPDFRFSLRTGDVSGKDRLNRGYWFPGTDRYLFFPPFRVNDPHNKTKTIGFVLQFSRKGQVRKASLNVVFSSVKDQSLAPVHEEIISQLGSFHQTGKSDKYQRVYSHPDAIAAFREFLATDLPRIREIISKSGREDAFVVTEASFNEMLDRVRQIKSATTENDSGGKAPPTADSPTNLILYGPPGTGKTHWLREQFKRYTDAAEQVDSQEWLRQQVADFGWRSVIAAVMADLGRPARVPEIRDHPWLVAKTLERGRLGGSVLQTIWAFLMGHTPEDVKTVHLANRRPPFIFTKSEESMWSLLADWREQDADAADLLRLLTSGPSKGSEVRRYRVVTFHPSFSYEDFVRGIRPVIDDEYGNTQFESVDGVFKEICDEARVTPGKRFALFIDEINRANISKVFGELITLVEPDKRGVYDESGKQTDGMFVQLPGGTGSDVAEEPFSVPSNLDLYGTMNTADRSIALLDIALRRRFQFREVEPDYRHLSKPMGTIDVGRMLRRINDRLEYLLDRDHRIGHAYLMNADKLDDLRRAFQVQIIPLLQEYFFDDFGRVALVLATRPGVPPFLNRETISQGALFPRTDDVNVPAERVRYTITDRSTWSEASFAGIYSSSPDAELPDQAI